MYVPAVESYVKDQVAKGRPVSIEAFMAHMKADHSPVEDVGRIAAEAGVKTLVLSHLNARHRHYQRRCLACSDSEIFQGRNHRCPRSDGRVKRYGSFPCFAIFAQ